MSRRLVNEVKLLKGDKQMAVNAIAPLNNSGKAGPPKTGNGKPKPMPTPSSIFGNK